MAQSDLNVSLELATSAMCDGTAHRYKAHCANTIQVNGNTLALELEATMNDAMNSHSDESVPSPSTNPKPKGFTSTQRFPCIDGC